MKNSLPNEQEALTLISFVTRNSSVITAAILFVFSLWMSVQFLPVKNDLSRLRDSIEAIAAEDKNNVKKDVNERDIQYIRQSLQEIKEDLRRLVNEKNK